MPTFLIFQQPRWLWLLCVAPIYWLLVSWSWYRFAQFLRKLRAKPYLYQAQLPSWRRRGVKALWYTLGLLVVVLALADPCYRRAIPENVYKGIRIYFLFDISRSMEMCEDVEPNRLAAAKKEIKDSYDQFEGAYEVAIVPFAGQALPYYFPPSFNSLSFRLSLDFLDSELIMTPGSDLLAAFGAVNQLTEAFGVRPDTVNVVVLLSDGGKDERSIFNVLEFKKAVKPLLDKKFRIYTIGVGGPDPTPLVQRDWAGNFQGYLINKQTNRPHVSQLDETVLKTIAVVGNGQYELFMAGGELKRILENIIEKNRQLLEIKYRYQYESVRFWFFLTGIAIFIFGELYTVSRSR